MTPGTLEPGHVVQLAPTDPMFAACFMTVEEVFAWGAQGYVLAPTRRGQPPAIYPYRADWEAMEPIGMTFWTVGGPAHA